MPQPKWIRDPLAVFQARLFFEKPGANNFYLAPLWPRLRAS
jgi:hypothetical protein